MHIRGKASIPLFGIENPSFPLPLPEHLIESPQVVNSRKHHQQTKTVLENTSKNNNNNNKSNTTNQEQKILLQQRQNHKQHTTVSFAKKIQIIECMIEFDSSQLDKQYPICLGTPYRQSSKSLVTTTNNNDNNSTMETKKRQEQTKKSCSFDKLSPQERKQLLLRQHTIEEIDAFERDRKILWARQRIQNKRRGSIENGREN